MIKLCTLMKCDSLLLFMVSCIMLPGCYQGDVKVNELGESNESGLSYDEFVSTTPPSPRKLVANMSQNSIELQWEAPLLPPPTLDVEYNLTVGHYVALRTTGKALFQIIGRSNTLSYTDKTVDPGTQYRYVVIVVQIDKSESNFSNEATAMLISGSK